MPSGRPWDSRAAGAYLGNETDRAQAAGLELNPAGLTTYLDWGRSYKTPYEVQCLEEATELGAKGHLAGRKAFLAGASELEIHYAFVQAVGCLDHQLAFSSIAALEPKGATLHYENKRSYRKGKVLLLDCGARVRDYASDITRTTRRRLRSAFRGPARGPGSAAAGACAGPEARRSLRRHYTTGPT